MKQGREQKPLGLSESDKIIFVEVASRLGVPRLVAIGSRVKGYWTESSDYDVLLVQTVSAELRKRAKEVGEQLGIKIDVVSGLHWQPSYGIYVEANK
jgi:predicted nucleotidyltransferase